jgi:hypothetical protein
MTGTIDQPTDDRGLDEEDPEVAALVRAAAASWRMPPRPIDALTWHDRVRTGGRHPDRRRLRAPAALGAAIAATVVVAVVGAWLTGSGAPPSGSPPSPENPAVVGPDASRIPGATAPSTPRSSASTATPLPTYLAAGSALRGVSALAVVGSAYSVVDMADGTVSPLLARLDEASSRVFALADGTFLCACSTVAAGSDGTRIGLVLRRFDAAGAPGPEMGGVAYEAVAGPPGGASPLSLEPTLSPDGQSVAVGWTAWDGARWTSGVDVVSTTTGSVVRGPGLPPVPGTATAELTLPPRWASYAGTGRPVSVWAPIVSMSPDGTTAIVRRSLVIDGTLVRTDWWREPIDGGTAGAPADLDLGGTEGTDQCVSGAVGYAGWTTPDVFATMCADSTTTVLRRVDAAGRRLADVDVAGALGSARYLGEGATVASPVDGMLYAWDPFARRLTAIDTVTGTARSADGIGDAGAAAPLDVLAGLPRALGRLLVPAAIAKTYLDPSIAASPDGRRLYLLGTSADAFESAGGASLGVRVVDAAALTVVATWAPTADLDSIAMSADGRYVLAAGAAGVDATGAEAPWEASITAWDATTGEVRAIAGRLGSSFVSLVRPRAR